MTDSIFLLFGVAVFVAVVLGLEGTFIWWNSTRGHEARRMESRLRALSAGGHGRDNVSILKQRALSESPAVERLLLKIPRIGSIDRLLLQSGLSLSVGDLLGLTLLLAVGPLVGCVFLGRGWLVGAGAAAALGSLPAFYVAHAKKRRLALLESQLPDGIDLMVRALRAGHAFPTALKMVGEEMSAPMGNEFRVLFDEINYGVGMQDALLNLVSRVPSADLRYFVVAVLIQRDTGGNLAELLENIAGMVRSRLKLMGEIRTLSAEGRLSAWILGALPFATAAAINVLSPGFMSVLWKDPTGLKLVWGALFMMVFGIGWMSRIIRIRV